MIDSTVIGSATDERLKTLLSYLASDPSNTALLTDAAEQALSADEPEVAVRILEEASGPLDPRQLNIAGLAELQCKHFDRAASYFERLLAEGSNDPAVKFNLAWAKAMQKDFAGALDLLDGTVTDTLGQAAMLEVQLLHEQGEFDDAAARARHHIGTHPDHPGLLAAVSVLALDIEDEELAFKCASGAGNHPDALTTLGTLALSDGRTDQAVDLFNRSIEANQGIPRAWVGRGLARLLTDDTKNAAADSDRGAELFGDHIGSWIASGWAYLLDSDYPTSRARFETAMAIDPDFAESHGSLAMLDAIEGRKAEAQHSIDIALRLDQQCFSATLAQSLLATGDGDQEDARRIFEGIMRAPINAQGQTVADTLVRMGMLGK